MRCSPWLPNARSSRPCSRSSTSSRCGPAEVVSRSRSRARRSASALAQPVDRRRPGRAVAQARVVAVAAEQPEPLLEQRLRAVAEPLPRRGDDGAGLGELLVPGVEVGRERAAGADAPQQRDALLEGRGVGAAGAGVGGPQAGDRAIDVGAAQGGRALHDVQALRQEHDAREALGEGVRAAHRRAVDGDALRLARRDGDARGRRPAALLALCLDAQEGLAVPDAAHVGRGARRRPDERHVQRLQQARLARAVRAGDEGRAGREAGLQGRVAAEGDGPEAIDAQSGDPPGPRSAGSA